MKIENLRYCKLCRSVADHDARSPKCPTRVIVEWHLKHGGKPEDMDPEVVKAVKEKP